MQTEFLYLPLNLEIQTFIINDQKMQIYIIILPHSRFDYRCLKNADKIYSSFHSTFDHK